jgi:hypothetical protein
LDISTRSQECGECDGDLHVAGKLIDDHLHRVRAPPSHLDRRYARRVVLFIQLIAGLGVGDDGDLIGEGRIAGDLTTDKLCDKPTGDVTIKAGVG